MVTSLMVADAQSAEYVKYAKIFGDYFFANFYTYRRSWQPFLSDFMPAEDLCGPFLKILCLLKLLASQWRPILAVFVLVSFQFPKILFLLRSKKDHARVCQFGDLRNGVDMKWYDYMKCNKEINCIFLKEKENCR